MVEVTEEQFDEFLDEIDEEVHIGTLTYMPSQVLKAVDPVAYRLAKEEYEDSLEEDE